MVGLIAVTDDGGDGHAGSAWDNADSHSHSMGLTANHMPRYRSNGGYIHGTPSNSN